MPDDVPSLVLTQRAQVSKPLFAYFFAVLWIGFGSAVLFFLVIAPVVGQEKVENVFDFSDDLNLVLHPVSDENKVVCGNGHCESSETVQTCFIDCFVCNNNGVCESSLGENSNSCPADCVPVPACNNNDVCETGENRSNCPNDCAAKARPFCGNGFCDGNENCSSCKSDCGSCPVCGDGFCDSSENCSSCQADCGSCSVACGNSHCDSNESCISCPSDCGSCICSAGQQRSCTITNSSGSCSGLQRCVNTSWGSCDANTPVAEACGDKIDNDCDGQVDEGCFSKLKAIWLAFTTDPQKATAWVQKLKQNGVSDAFGAFDYFNGNVMSTPLQNFAGATQQQGINLIPKVTFSYQWQLNGINDYNCLYYNGVALVDTNLIHPLSQAYWDSLTNLVVQMATLSKTTMPSIRGVAFDFELYNYYDKEYYYFSYDGSYDTETFQSFVTEKNLSSLDPPVSEERKMERYSWLSSHNLVNDYHLFVASLAESRARAMANAVYAVNPDFLIMFYPPPLWNNGRFNDPPSYWHYWFADFLDFYRGWDSHQKFLLLGTEMYVSGGAANLPGSLNPNGRFDWVRQDTGEKINMYYAGGFLMGRYKLSDFEGVFDTADQSNGYWIFEGLPLLVSCNELMQGSEKINICKPGIPQVCCDDPDDMNINDWYSQCCGSDSSAFNTTVQEYWDKIKEINQRLDSGNGSGIHGIDEPELPP